MSAVLDDNHKLIGRKDIKEELTEDEIRKEKISKTLTQISKQILNKLSKDKVPATPENFKVYFETQLEGKPVKEKKEIEGIIDLDISSTSAHTAALERDVQDAFVHIKSMTESVANAYKVLSNIKKVTAQKSKEFAKNPSTVAFISYEESLEESIKKLEQEIKSIKTRYNSTASLIKDFSQNTIFDKKYGVYNKKYLLRSIESLQESIKAFEYDNTLLAIRIKPALLKSVHSQNEKNMLTITLAKLLFKRSRRSDIVAHYGDGIFMIVLKHATKEQAQKAVDRITEMVESSNFIVGGDAIDMEITVGIVSIDKDKSKEEIIIEAIDNL